MLREINLLAFSTGDDDQRMHGKLGQTVLRVVHVFYKSSKLDNYLLQERRNPVAAPAQEHLCSNASPQNDRRP